MDVGKLRLDFPILKRKINGKPLAYLDSAATSQKPRQVIDAVSGYYQNHNANVHRSVHTLSDEATRLFEGARKKTAEFVGARSAREIVFTRNATEAINLVKHSFVLPRLENGKKGSIGGKGARSGKGNKIISTIMEHHSNFVPWQQCAKFGAKPVFVGIDSQGQLDYGELEKELAQGDALLVAVCHASNTLGTINDVKKICRMAKKAGAAMLVDAAQSVPHMPLSVKEIGCDFLALSGHKMLGPTGIGCLYAKKELLDEMPPFLLGGEMIKEVSVEQTTWNDFPWKFEAGTPDIAGAVGLGAAIDYLNGVGLKQINLHEQKLVKYALEELSKIRGVELYGPIDFAKRCGLVSFNVRGIHPHDLATILDGEGVEIRSGQNCTQPLIDSLRIPNASVARASFYLYNLEEEIDRLCAGVLEAKKVFGV